MKSGARIDVSRPARCRAQRRRQYLRGRGSLERSVGLARSSATASSLARRSMSTAATARRSSTGPARSPANSAPPNRCRPKAATSVSAPSEFAIVEDGATIDVSGGSTRYTDAEVTVTRLQDSFGRFHNISDRRSESHYIGISKATRQSRRAMSRAPSAGAVESLSGSSRLFGKLTGDVVVGDRQVMGRSARSRAARSRGRGGRESRWRNRHAQGRLGDAPPRRTRIWTLVVDAQLHRRRRKGVHRHAVDRGTRRTPRAAPPEVLASFVESAIPMPCSIRSFGRHHAFMATRAYTEGRRSALDRLRAPMKTATGLALGILSSRTISSRAWATSCWARRSGQPEPDDQPRRLESVRPPGRRSFRPAARTASATVGNNVSDK